MPPGVASWPPRPGSPTPFPLVALAFCWRMVQDDIAVVTSVPHRWRWEADRGPGVFAVWPPRARLAGSGQLHGGGPRPLLSRAGGIDPRGEGGVPGLRRAGGLPRVR